MSDDDPVPEGADPQADAERETERRRRQLLCRFEIAGLQQRAYWEDIRLIVTLAMEEVTATRLKLLEDYARSADERAAAAGSGSNGFSWEALVVDILIASAFVIAPELLFVRLGGALVLRSASLLRIGKSVLASPPTMQGLKTLIAAERVLVKAKAAQPTWLPNQITKQFADLSGVTRQVIKTSEKAVVTFGVKQAVGYIADQFVESAVASGGYGPDGRRSQPEVQALGAIHTWINARITSEALTLAELKCLVLSSEAIDADLAEGLLDILGETLHPNLQPGPNSGLLGQGDMPEREIAQREIEAFLWASLLGVMDDVGDRIQEQNAEPSPTISEPTTFPLSDAINLPIVMVQDGTKLAGLDQQIAGLNDQLIYAAFRNAFPGVIAYLMDRILVDPTYDQGLITHRHLKLGSGVPYPTQADALLARLGDIRSNYKERTRDVFRYELQRQ